MNVFLIVSIVEFVLLLALLVRSIKVIRDWQTLAKGWEEAAILVRRDLNVLQEQYRQLDNINKAFREITKTKNENNKSK